VIAWVFIYLEEEESVPRERFQEKRANSSSS